MFIEFICESLIDAPIIIVIADAVVDEHENIVVQKYFRLFIIFSADFFW